MRETVLRRQPEPEFETAGMTDEELVQRVLDGHTAAYDAIVSRYKDRVFSYCFRMLGDPETASEVSQDIFLRAYRYLSHFRGDSKFSTWLYTVVSSTCKNASMYHSLRAKKREENVVTNEEGRSTDIIDRLPDKSMSPELLAERSNLMRVIGDAIQSIPDMYRQIIILKDVNDLSYEEIAKILNCQLGTVKSRLARARLMVREKLLAAGISPESDLQ